MAPLFAHSTIRQTRDSITPFSKPDRTTRLANRNKAAQKTADSLSASLTIPPAASALVTVAPSAPRSSTKRGRNEEEEADTPTIGTERPVKALRRSTRTTCASSAVPERSVAPAIKTEKVVFSTKKRSTRVRPPPFVCRASKCVEHCH
jgi:hypothetical protein